MTDATPIPSEAFADALGRLDSAELAALVGALQRAMADGAAVEVDPPLVTVTEGNSTRRILVVAAESDAARESGRVDQVVQADEAADSSDTDPSVLTPADLRDQLLYAISPAEADSVSDEFLSMPARSSAYLTESAEPRAEDDGDETAADPAASGTASTTQSGSAAVAGMGSQEPSVEDRTTSSGDEGSSRDRSTESASATDWVEPRRAAAVVFALLVVAGGVAASSGLSADDAAGGLPGFDGADDERQTPSERETVVSTTATTAEPGTSTGAGMEAEVLDGGGTNGSDGSTVAVAATNRNFLAEPTCTRSFLLVTQIQMNALRHNDNETNAGIRTVRRFASPTNRRAVDSFEEYVEVIRSTTYSAMLTYDSVRYEPARIDNRTAQVRVVTRENGTVTGRYEFFLRKIGDGEYEGCWMTDAVLTQAMMVFDVGVGK